MWRKRLLVLSLMFALASPNAAWADCPVAISCGPEEPCFGELDWGAHGDYGLDLSYKFGYMTIDVCHWDLCKYDMTWSNGSEGTLIAYFMECFQDGTYSALYLGWK